MNKAQVDTYREELLERITRIEEKGKAHFEITKEIRVDVKAQNGRVRKLENRQSWFMGVGSVTAFVFGSLIAWIKGEM